MSPKPVSLTEMVARDIRRAIMAGEFGFGENISEEKLVARYGVSRTPVRDALNSLAATGLVVIRPKHGSFVFTPSAADVRALCDYRMVLEREAMKLAVALDAEGLADSLSEALEQMNGDLAAFARADTAFHAAFFAHCGNAHMQAAYRLCEAHIAALRQITLLDEPSRARAKREHEQLLDHLLAREYEPMRKLLRNHINAMREKAASARA